MHLHRKKDNKMIIFQCNKSQHFDFCPFKLDDALQSLDIKVVGKWRKYFQLKCEFYKAYVSTHTSIYSLRCIIPDLKMIYNYCKQIGRPTMVFWQTFCFLLLVHLNELKTKITIKKECSTCICNILIFVVLNRLIATRVRHCWPRINVGRL